MRNSRTLARLRNGEPVRICSLGHFIPSYVAHAARHGYDCIWLDLEHNAISTEEFRSLMPHFHMHDIDCMVRPKTRDRTSLYRYLEDGATGLLIPHVSTPELAQELVDAVKFPPLGDRGICGANLDSDYLGHPLSDYIEHAIQETFLVVQLETPTAIENAEKIASTPGVDGLFVGPGDLGIRVAHDATAMSVEAAIAHVAEIAAKTNKAWGLPVTADSIRTRRDQGAQLLAHGNDFLAMLQMLEQWSGEFTNALSPANNGTAKPAQQV
ncbi:aldolase/citrate lyase family protein [Bremerella sp. JC770]|uniref:HpcH/HpaI aldolase family protein n=1 Tax=Bremerella sp. JC770 TaxID=3232137 RepID=UPI003457D9F8